MNINNLDGTMIDADFVAVKIGDVNGNANATQARSAATLALGVEDVTVEAGEEYTVAITPEAANAYQFTMGVGN